MVGPGRGTWIFAKQKKSLQSNEWIFQVNTFRWKGSNPVEESHWFLVACTFIIEPSGHVFGKNLETRPGNSWECEAFQCEVFMAQELSVFFFEGDEFSDSKKCSGSWCSSWVWHFFLPIKICEGRWGWRSWRKRCSDCSIPPRISKQVEKHEWEIPWKYRKILISFYRGPVTTPPGHSDFCKTSHHSCQLSAFHPPVFAVFQVQHFLRMFWKKKILKNLGHQDHTQTEEMGSPQFLRWGGIFWAASWRVLFGGVKMIGDTWYVLNLVERHVEVGDLMAPYAWLNLRVLDTRKVRLLPN